MYPVPVSHALSCLDVSIKYYYLSLRPRLRVLVPPCCVHRDRRPDLTVSGALHPFCFPVFKSLCFDLFVSVLRQGSRHSSSRHSPLQDGVGVRQGSPRVPRVRWPRAIMPADRGRYPPPAVALPSPPAGSPGLPLPRRAVRGRSRHRIAADSMPAGPPLTQCLPLTHARRIAADSGPSDRR